MQNIADPVPMVPCYSYVHAPFGESGILVAKGSANLSDIGHSPENVYRPAVAGSTWRSLRNSGPSFLQMAETAGLDNLMMLAQTQPPNSVFSFWILRKILTNILQLIHKLVPLALTGIVTLVDQIAYVLHHAAAMLDSVGKQIREWIGLVMRAVGNSRGVSANTVNLSVSFLRWILEMLARPVISMAERALSALF